MTPEMIDLARRAVASKGWRWMTGMKTILGYRVSDEDAHTAAPTPFADDIPDLTDPATVGCLLALARTAWEVDPIDVVPLVAAIQFPPEAHARYHAGRTSLKAAP